MKDKFYLVAISGDVSAYGMGDVADVILVDKKHKKIITEFLIAQTKWRVEACYYNWKDKKDNPLPPAHDNYYNCVYKLWDIGIFNNKWQARSEWELMHEYSLKEVNYKYEIKENK